MDDDNISREESSDQARWVSCHHCECDGPIVCILPKMTHEECERQAIEKWNMREGRCDG